MKTTFDLVDIIWTALNASDLKNQITGGIYKYQRPLNSKNEDVVINSLPVTNDQLQKAIINVNIHVPNLVIDINGAQDSTQPDGARLKELGELAIAALDDKNGYRYNHSVQQQNIIQDTDDFFNNIRLQIFSF